MSLVKILVGWADQLTVNPTAVSHMLLSAALDELELSLSVSVRSSTLDFYKAGVRTLIRYLGDKRTRCIRRGDLLRWHRWASGRYAPKSVAGYTKGIKRLFGWLHVEGRIPENPAVVLRVNERQAPKVRAVTEADYRALLAAAAPDPRLHLFITLLADTGARVSELLNIDVADIMLDHQRQRGRIRVEGKTGERWVVFGSGTYRELSSYLLFHHPDSRWLFVSGQTGKPLLSGSMRHAMYKAADRAGCKGRVNPHSFRHRFARIYLQRGGDMASLSRLLGHSSVAITLKYYVHWSDTELDDLHAAIDPARIDIE